MFGSSNSTSNSTTASNSNPQADVLAGGFGGGLGNGFGNMTSNASTSSNASGSGGATSFDLSDFPSLGGGAAGGVGNNNGLAQALRQQQLLAHQQQQQAAALLGGTAASSGSSTASGGNKPNAPVGGNSNNNAASAMYRLAMTGTHGNNFTIAKEDFPALGSSLLGGTSVANATATNNNSNPNPSSVIHRTTTNSSSNANNASSGSGAAPGLYDSTANANADLTSGGLEGAGLLGGAGASSLGLGGLPPASRSATGTNSGSSTTNNNSNSANASNTNSNNSSTATSNNSNANAGSALQGDYGLLGLLGVIRMTDADRNALALGSDLTLLGLNLGTAEHIYSTFASPWADATSKEPHYELPSCYYMQPPALKTGHLSKFQLETLFYIFYALPKDVLQAYAAQELYSREWRYHGELKLWFKRASTSDGLTATAASTGQYLYFDINTWERRLFNGNMNQNITNGFLPEGEVQVKFSQS